MLSSTRVTHDFDAATLQEMSNCYCLPGRAGGPPLDVSEAQGRYREVTSEGSVEQNRDLTNRNRIGGILGRTSGQRVAKSISIKGQGCRSGRCAGKAIELTWGDLRCVPGSELREPKGDLTPAQESA